MSAFFHKWLSGILSAAMLLTSSTMVQPSVSAVSAVSFAESTDTILNPGMGYTTTLWYRCAPNRTEVKNPVGSLVLMFIDIGAFSSGENGTYLEDGTYEQGTDYLLDDSFFAGLRGTFENCRSNGSTIALRFRYDDDGTKNPEPATFDMLKKHIRQIGDSHILEDYQDILMYVESGFVGCYGEQWGGKYCSLEEKAELLEMLLEIVPDPIPVTVRTPNIFAAWCGIPVSELENYVSEPGSKAARVGLYDDGYMGSDSDLGTYSNRVGETTWLGRQAETSYFGGEYSGNLEFAQKYDTYLPQNAIPEMYKTHVSYINSNIFKLYQNDIFSSAYDISQGDHSAYYGQTVYKFIRDHLGYRFVLRAVNMPESVTQGQKLKMQFAVENTGFANPIRSQNAEILLEKNGNYMRASVPLDSRTWRSAAVTEQSLQIQIPGELEPGEWNVYLKLSVGDNTVSQMAMRSVQFANPDIWDAGLGANYLGTIQVQNSDAPKEKVKKGDSTDFYTLNHLQITDGAVSNEAETASEKLAASSDSGKLYISNDDSYLYISATYNQNAAAEVHNISFTNQDNGIHYWLYYASNGFIYFNQGQPDGVLQKHSGGWIEFRIPLGDVMGLELGTALKDVRYSLQDSANEWVVMTDIKAPSYVLKGDFQVYSVCQTLSLEKHENALLSVHADVKAPANYQWYHDNEKIAGANQPDYEIKDADEAAEGEYAVTITSALGTEKNVKICTVRKVYDLENLPLSGDVNGDQQVNAADAQALMQYLLTKQNTISHAENADMNSDGIINAVDLSLLRGRIQKKLV
ncbi:MAG: DUF4832 domain-containing protein [Oscillospiraceae bacterium]|nr:DUF4832 domain-containing protein [Oscillospiraceae bacterium]